MNRRRATTSLVLALMLCATMAPSTALPKKSGDCKGIEFNPGNAGAQGQMNRFGVDLNELYGESHPLVLFGNTVVYTGEHYVPYSHWFVTADQIKDFQDNLQYRKYVVTDALGKSTTYVCDDESIATTSDRIHGDALTCGDFFLTFCGSFGMTADTAMIAWLPKLPPRPPGHYTVELILGMDHDQTTVIDFLPAGETTQAIFEFDVLPGKRPG